MNTCLLIVDVQKGFVSNYTEHVPRRIRKLLEDSTFDNIIFTRFYNASASPFREILGWNNLTTKDEQELAPEVMPFAGVIYDKSAYTAVNPSLLQSMREAEYDAVFIAGIDTDCCVLTTAVDLFQAGIRPCVLSHYCASNGGAASHAAALTCLGRLVGLHNIISGEINRECVASVLSEPVP